MVESWSRRKFLEAGAVAPVSAGRILSRPIANLPHGTSALFSDERATLIAAMDEIIPAGEGMPSASQAGCLPYLDRLAEDHVEVRAQLQEALLKLNVLAGSFGRSEFGQLSSDLRVRALIEFETGSSDRGFVKLRDLVYEAYYTRPDVWKLIGFEFYPPERPGPLPPPFDEAVLAHVREMPKLYREVR